MCQLSQLTINYSQQKASRSQSGQKAKESYCRQKLRVKSNVVVFLVKELVHNY